MREGAQRDLCSVGPDHKKLGQGLRAVLKLRLNLEDELVLIGRGIDRRNLTLTEGIIQRLVDDRGRQPQPGDGVAIDLDRDMRRRDLLIGGDILQLGKL